MLLAAIRVSTEIQPPHLLKSKIVPNPFPERRVAQYCLLMSWVRDSRAPSLQLSCVEGSVTVQHISFH